MPAAPARISGTPLPDVRAVGATVGPLISTTDHWPPPGNAGAPDAAMTNSGSARALGDPDADLPHVHYLGAAPMRMSASSGPPSDRPG